VARIDWALLCDLAFFDRQDRLCVVGIVRKLPAPGLPLAIGQMMLVAHLTEIRPVEEVGVSVAVITPGGVLTAPNSSDCISVELAQGYVLVTLRGTVAATSTIALPRRAPGPPGTAQGRIVSDRRSSAGR
jgi:hypothetical protein